MSESQFITHPIYTQLLISVSEVWRWVVGYEGHYKVSNWGRVKSIARNAERHRKNRKNDLLPVKERILKTHQTGQLNYVNVSLCKNGKRKEIRLHWLVLEAFVCERPNGMFCRHLDGNNKNNRLENLAWGTRSENEMDKVKHGKSNRGERHGNSKLTEDGVREIRSLHATGKWSFDELGKRHGVLGSAIKQVINGSRWGWLK